MYLLAHIYHIYYAYVVIYFQSLSSKYPNLQSNELDAQE